MRSEERSGIIAISLILLWGTLVTEPFRYFAEIICMGIGRAADKFGAHEGGKIEALVITVVMTLIALLFLKFSSTKIGHYFGPFVACVSTAVSLGLSLAAGEIDVKVTAALLIWVVLILLILIFKVERALIWISDMFILSVPVFLLSSWIFVPVKGMSKKVAKYFFIAFRSKTDLAAAYGSFLTVPKIVWGIFFSVLMLLPVIYFVSGRRKG